MRKIVILSLILILTSGNLCLAGEPGQISNTASQILRMQELLEKERALREKIEEEKFYIKEIVVNGSSLLNQKQIANMMMPYKKRMLTKEDIEKILKLIESVYEQLGAKDRISQITYKIENLRLIIDIKEQ
jgi:hemolysin activation/secretion protein